MKLDNTQIAIIGAVSLTVVVFGLWWFGYLGGTHADLKKHFEDINKAYNDWKKATSDDDKKTKRTTFEGKVEALKTVGK